MVIFSQFFWLSKFFIGQSASRWWAWESIGLAASLYEPSCYILYLTQLRYHSIASDLSPWLPSLFFSHLRPRRSKPPFRCPTPHPFGIYVVEPYIRHLVNAFCVYSIGHLLGERNAKRAGVAVNASLVLALMISFTTRLVAFDFSRYV